MITNWLLHLWWKSFRTHQNQLRFGLIPPICPQALFVLEHSMKNIWANGVGIQALTGTRNARRLRFFIGTSVVAKVLPTVVSESRHGFTYSWEAFCWHLQSSSPSTLPSSSWITQSCGTNEPMHQTKIKVCARSRKTKSIRNYLLLRWSFLSYVYVLVKSSKFSIFEFHH